MKMLVKDTNDRYLKVDDIDLVFTNNIEEACSFSDMDVEDFMILKEYIETTYKTELETIFK